MNINYLKIPMYQLYYLDNITGYHGIDIKGWSRARELYSQKHFEGIIEALRWAKQNPNHNFETMLPGLPYGNKEIYDYLCKVLDSYERYISDKT